jgi:hypothetical protein
MEIQILGATQYVYLLNLVRSTRKSGGHLHIPLNANLNIFTSYPNQLLMM